MDKVIDGLLYDTKKAEWLGSDKTEQTRGAYRELYCSKGGRYFVAHCSNLQGAEETLEALTEDQAFALACEICEGSTVAEWFAERVKPA